MPLVDAPYPITFFLLFLRKKLITFFTFCNLKLNFLYVSKFISFSSSRIFFILIIFDLILFCFFTTFTSALPPFISLKLTSTILSPFLSKIFLNIHKSKFDVKYKLGDKFHLIKKKIKIENINLKNKYDLVYFDLFAPRVHPNLWTVKIFKQIYDIMNFGSILVTYCSKGSVKRNLKECGFKIESCPGPPGKREITRAVK